MRTITKQAVEAFNNSRPFHKANMSVIVNDGYVGMALHGNIIARRKNGTVEITTAGWPTNTTLERLRGLGASVYRKSHILHKDGKQWDGNWTKLS